MSELKSQVAEWYNDKSVFITGGTGFMGKVLLEKLLYSCLGIKYIYLLLRNKKGKTPHQRVEDMWQLPMFDRLRKVQPNAIRKIVPLTGDVSTDELGLTKSDVELLRNDVNVVFHMAAILRMNAKLKDAVGQNVAGTARVLDVCKTMKNLRAFVYFSTAFCFVDVEVLEEKVYRSKDNPRDIINIIKLLKSDVTDLATPSLIAPHPNTYTYTKRLAENLIADEVDNMPVCIIRPSIVIPAVEEPLPGWVDNLNGPIGLLVGAGKGVIRSMHCKGENRGNFIPVDFAVNASIVIAQLTANSKNTVKEVPVYNLTQDSQLPVTFREILNKGRSIYYEHPFEFQIWYPDGDLRSSKYVHNLYSVLYHWLPALFIDFLLLICRQKTFNTSDAFMNQSETFVQLFFISLTNEAYKKHNWTNVLMRSWMRPKMLLERSLNNMLRLQKRIHEGLQVLQFFSVREWNFKCEKFLGLNGFLTEADRKMFPIANFHYLPLEEYLRVSILGVRQYCLKEDLSSLPRCRRKQKLLYVIHKLCVYGFYVYVFYLLTWDYLIVKTLF